MHPDDVAANLIAEGESYDGFPAPWTFDGTRRLYSDRKPESWVARAVDLTAPELGMEIPVAIGEGATPMEAVIDLVKRLTEDADVDDEAGHGRGGTRP